MDCGPPGSSVHGILQARILEWVAMPSSRGPFQPRGQIHNSCGSYIKGELNCWATWKTPIPLSVSLSVSLSLCLSLSLAHWLARLLAPYLFQTDALECRGSLSSLSCRASKTLSRRCSVPSPHREGAWGLPEQSKPHAGGLLAFCVNKRISASFSPLLSYHRLQTTNFRSIKGPQQGRRP